jgi:hypothetical protein
VAKWQGGDGIMADCGGRRDVMRFGQNVPTRAFAVGRERHSPRLLTSFRSRTEAQQLTAQYGRCRIP